MAITVKKSIVIIGVLSLLALSASVLMSSFPIDSKSTYIDPSDKQLVAAGKKIYDRDCASCHGAKLEGEPNWRIRQENGRLPAPPHDETGHTWHHADALLVEITKNGLVPGVTAPEGYVSDMPAYNASLSDQNIHAVLAYIKSSWPEHALARQKAINQQQE